MSRPEIRLEILKLAFEIARETSRAAVLDIDNYETTAARADVVPHVEDVLEIADGLLEFVYPEQDEEFAEMVTFDPEEELNEV